MSLCSVLFNSEQILSHFFCIESKEIAFKDLRKKNGRGLDTRFSTILVLIGVATFYSDSYWNPALISVPKAFP